VVALASGVLGAPAAGDAGPTGRVVGVVRLAGPPPAPRAPLAVTVDPAVCGTAVPDEALRVGADGGIADATVVVRGVRPPPAPLPAAAVVDNAGCRFVPRVQVVVRGQSVRVRNSDPVLHNARPVLADAPATAVANLALARRGQEMDLTRRLAAVLPPAGDVLLRLGCDVHPWMRGWLLVVDGGPAAVTGAAGEFAIGGVPAGTYTVAVWHEVLGRAERAVTVPPGGDGRVDVVLAPPE
jgi:hypothetical protein